MDCSLQLAHVTPVERYGEIIFLLGSSYALDQTTYEPPLSSITAHGKSPRLVGPESRVTAFFTCGSIFSSGVYSYDYA